MKFVTSEELKEAVLDYGTSAARSKSFSERSGAYKAICHVIDAFYARPGADELAARLAVAEQEIKTLRSGVASLLGGEPAHTPLLVTERPADMLETIHALKEQLTEKDKALGLADKVYEMAANALGAQRFSLEQYRKARAAYWATIGVVERP